MLGLSPETAKKLILSVGTHRSERPLTPIETAAAMKQAIDNGATAKEIASRLHFDGPTMVSRFIKLLHLVPSVQPLVGWGSDASTLSFSAACEIARLTGPEQEIAAQAVLSHQLGLSEVKQLVQVRSRSGKPLEEAVKAVVERRPVVIQRHVLVGAITADGVREKISGMSQEERNTMLRDALSRLGPNITLGGAKLGKENFTLVGDKQMRDTFMALPSGFEAAVSQYLQQELSNKG